jgi:hypothetical protein
VKQRKRKLGGIRRKLGGILRHARNFDAGRVRNPLDQGSLQPKRDFGLKASAIGGCDKAPWEKLGITRSADYKRLFLSRRIGGDAPRSSDEHLDHDEF